jgi:PIN domain nuclease of toxin-antitoxin system
MPTPSVPCLLDTHVWVWLVNGSVRLGRSKALAFIRAAARTRAVGVSIISIWEIALLEAKGRLSLGLECSQWVHEALSAPGVGLLELTPREAIASTRLPGNVHGDPADRMLVATARERGLTLVTADEQLLRYGAEGHVAVRGV